MIATVPSLDVTATAVSAAVVVLIGSIPVLIGYLVKLGQRLSTLEHDTPMSFDQVNKNIQSLAETVKNNDDKTTKAFEGLHSKVDSVLVGLAEMKGRNASKGGGSTPA